MKINWKKLLKLEQFNLLGLDIGSSTVKVVQLVRDGNRYRVSSAGISSIPQARDDKNQKEINTARAISSCLKSAGISAQHVVCSVCGPDVAVRSFNFPSLPPDEVEAAVMLEASQVCPFPTDGSTVDYQLTDHQRRSSAETTTGILVAATNKLIMSKTRLTENANLSCALMDVDGLALLNCFKQCEQTRQDQAAAILNVGSSFTNLAIINDNEIPFVRDIAYAGDEIIRQIANEHNFSAETVSEILSGREDGKLSRPKLDESLERACKKLIVDVSKTLRYYTAQEKTTIKEIFVCGGFALTEGFIDLLERQLPVRAVLWNPFEKMKQKSSLNCPEVVEKNGPAMAVAAGLAMRSI